MTTQQVQEGIHILHAIDPLAPDAFESATNAYKHMGKLPFFILDLPTLPINVFHTRTHDTDDYFEKIEEIALPPVAAVKNFARCNIPKHPVFYCSDYRPTSYMELAEYWLEEKTEQYLYVTIGKWTIENSLKVLIVTSPYAADRLTAYDKTHGERLDHFMNVEHVELKEPMTLLYKFLFDKFRKPAKKDLLTYLITSTYCDFAFNQHKDEIEAVLYPSVPYDGKGVNIAIKANYPFKQNMKLILVARDTFERTEENGLAVFQQAAHRQAQSVDNSSGSITW